MYDSVYSFTLLGLLLQHFEKIMWFSIITLNNLSNVCARIAINEQNMVNFTENSRSGLVKLTDTLKNRNSIMSV